MRTLNTAGEALFARALDGEAIPCVHLLYLGLTVPQYFCIGGSEAVWDGHTWQPLDIAMSEVEDTTSERTGLKFSFPGVAESSLALALAEDVEGAAVELYAALRDPDTGAIADAMLMWAGELEQAGWQDGAEALVNFTAEHLQDIAARPKPSRYTDGEQQRLYSGDTFFRYDVGADKPSLVWPSASYFKR